MKLIILAAGQGARLRPHTESVPKCLVRVANRPILDRLIEVAKIAGIHDLVLVGGYRHETLKHYGIPVVVNNHYLTTNMVHSLFCAEEYFGDGFVVSYSDILYRPEHLLALVQDRADVSVVVDDDWLPYWRLRFDNILDDAERLSIINDRIVEIGGRPASEVQIDSQYIGLLAFRGSGVGALQSAYAQAKADGSSGRLRFGSAKTTDAMYITDLLQGMADRGVDLHPVRVRGGWVEVDSPQDLLLAEKLIAAGRLGEH
jgi:choline kinase